MINASYCYHHFVSSWMMHNKALHNSTDSSRRSGKGKGLVPAGQTFRASNQWRSFGLGAAPVPANLGRTIGVDGGGTAEHESLTTATTAPWYRAG